MKNKQKNSKLISGIVVLVLGILVAIFGGQAVLDVYFGVIALISALALLSLTAYQMAKKQFDQVSNLVLGAIFAAVGIGLFTDFLTFAAIINFLVLAILGAGAGLFLYGVYCLVAKNAMAGFMNLLVGAGAITLSVLYITVAEFRTAFWIVVGVLIAVYGLCQTVIVLMDMIKGSKKAKN